MLLQRDVAKMRKEMESYRRDSHLPSFLFDDETQDLQQELAVLRGDYDQAKKVRVDHRKSGKHATNSWSVNIFDHVCHLCSKMCTRSAKFNIHVNNNNKITFYNFYCA